MADTPTPSGPQGEKPKLVARSMRNDPGRREPAAPADTPAPKPATPAPVETPTDSAANPTDRVPLSSTMFIAVNMREGDRRTAILNALDVPAATLKPFAEKYRVIAGKRTDKDKAGEPAEFRVYLDTAAAERSSGSKNPDEIGHDLLTELVRSSRVRMRDSEYVAVVLPLKDKDNPRTVSLDAANQWRYWDAIGKNEPKAAPVDAPARSLR